MGRTGEGLIVGAWRWLPAEFREDRIFLHPVTRGGQRLVLWADSGGGVSFLCPQAAHAVGAAVEPMGVKGRNFDVARPPALREDGWIPLIPLLLVMTFEEAAGGHSNLFDGADGFLGQNWFADRAWLLDYPAKRIAVWDGTGGPAAPRGAASAPLGFQEGARFPRVAAEVDGEAIDFLLDTGATMVATAAAQAVLGPPRLRAASFVVQSVFDRWRARHPEWRVIENADASFGDAAIEVPELRLAGVRLGPVWFAARGDEKFARMSRFTDRPILGALGGSALRACRLIVDYPRAVCHVADGAADWAQSSS